MTTVAVHDNHNWNCLSFISESESNCSELESDNEYIPTDTSDSNEKCESDVNHLEETVATIEDEDSSGKILNPLFQYCF